MLSPSLSPSTLTTDRGSRMARLLPHFATCMMASKIYDIHLYAYILIVIAAIFKAAIGSTWRFIFWAKIGNGLPRAHGRRRASKRQAFEPARFRKASLAAGADQGSNSHITH